MSDRCRVTGKKIVARFKRNERTGVVAGSEKERAEAKGGDSSAGQRWETNAGIASEKFRTEHKRAADGEVAAKNEKMGQSNLTSSA